MAQRLTPRLESLAPDSTYLHIHVVSSRFRFTREEDVMEKPIAGFLQAGAAYMFFAAGLFGGDALLLLAPAIVSGAAGLLLWGRASRRTTASSDEQAPPPDPRLNQVQDALLALQDDVTQIREDRDFMRSLYSGSSSQSNSVSKQ